MRADERYAEASGSRYGWDSTGLVQAEALQGRRRGSPGHGRPGR